ncbi:ATP-dependent protease ATPase subunit HslU [Striga asiatica]|uniref:ATP-dependent protease ATPase subunit HslU n=1 Tax=Striga asiatica TaxID=4170 RepID=A0A5A7P0Y5_STRAF|nr:ATP-dependent protease ATPase subunit HslU [Striga asiatica]
MFDGFPELSRVFNARMIINIAAAANDVLLEPESFGLFSKHLLEIDIILTELQSCHLSDSPIARLAFESLKFDVKKVDAIIDKQVQKLGALLPPPLVWFETSATKSESLSKLSPLSALRPSRESPAAIKRLQDEMHRAQHEVSCSRVEIVDKLKQGLTIDLDFTNDMLKKIARAYVRVVDKCQCHLWMIINLQVRIPIEFQLRWQYSVYLGVLDVGFSIFTVAKEEERGTTRLPSVTL